MLKGTWRTQRRAERCYDEPKIHPKALRHQVVPVEAWGTPKGTGKDPREKAGHKGLVATALWLWLQRLQAAG